MFNKPFIIIAFAALAFLSAEPALAQIPTNPIEFLSRWLYPGLIAAATMLAVFMIIFAGFKWMTGAVSPPQVSEAKSYIYSALTGLALALGSWLILYIINPNLLLLKTPQVQQPTGAVLTFINPDGTTQVLQLSSSLDDCATALQNDSQCQAPDAQCSCDSTYSTVCPYEDDAACMEWYNAQPQAGGAGGTPGSGGGGGTANPCDYDACFEGSSGSIYTSQANCVAAGEIDCTPAPAGSMPTTPGATVTCYEVGRVVQDPSGNLYPSVQACTAAGNIESGCTDAPGAGGIFGTEWQTQPHCNDAVTGAIGSAVPGACFAITVTSILSCQP